MLLYFTTKMKRTVKTMLPESSAKGKKTMGVVYQNKLKKQSDEENNSSDATSPEPMTASK